MSCSPESRADEVRSAVVDQLQRINDRDIEGFLAHCDPDIRFTFPGTSIFAGEHHGLDRIEQFFHRLFQVVPDLRFDYRTVMAGEEMAAVEWVDDGITFTGAPFTNAGVTIVRLRDNRLVEMRDHLDTEKLTQFGSVTAKGPDRS